MDFVFFVYVISFIISIGLVITFYMLMFDIVKTLNKILIELQDITKFINNKVEKKCPNCNVSNLDSATVCKTCGTTLI